MIAGAWFTRKIHDSIGAVESPGCEICVCLESDLGFPRASILVSFPLLISSDQSASMFNLQRLKNEIARVNPWL